MPWPFRRKSEPSCWICGKPADSSEHKLKRTDIVAAYGQGAYRENESGLVGHLVDGTLAIAQSANDFRFKYPKSLCQQCNSTASQPFDLAYERFMAWVHEHRDRVLRERLVDLTEVFDETSFSASSLHLYKYFAKSFGCRVIDAGHKVPPDVQRLMPRVSFRTRLRITFAVNTSLFYVGEELQRCFLALGGLQSIRNQRNAIVGYVCHQQVSWLRIGYWYNLLPWSRHGAGWSSDSVCVYLGDIESASEKMIRDIQGGEEFVTGSNLNALVTALARRDPKVAETYPARTQRGVGPKE